MTVYSLFITCPRGLEAPLTQELENMACQDIRAVDGGVACKGTMEQVYRINLHSRVASRVLLRLTKGGYRNEHDIYKLARNLHWTGWFKLEQTFKVKVEGKRANVKSLDFVGLKIKDAVCDAFRDIYDARPSVGKINPDIRIHAFIDERNVEIFIDTSGEALFKRGYRQDTGEAPLRENLAAGLLLLAGYDGTQPFQDPFCGSGTIAIEAAWIATHRAPGLMRRFGFEKLQNFDKKNGKPCAVKLKKQNQTGRRAEFPAANNDRYMIRAALANAQPPKWIISSAFGVQDAQAARPNGEYGIMISNPPYGVRLAEIQALQALYPQLGTWLKQHYAGWLVGMFTGDRDMPKFMRLSPKRKIPLFNGNLDCRLFLMDMVKGSNRG